MKSDREEDARFGFRLCLLLHSFISLIAADHWLNLSSVFTKLCIHTVTIEPKEQDFSNEFMGNKFRWFIKLSQQITPVKHVNGRLMAPFRFFETFYSAFKLKQHY